MDKQLIRLAALLVAGLSPAMANTCTSLSAGNLDSAARWSNCGGMYPQNGDSIIVGHAIVQNVPGLILGGSTAPVNGYVDSVTASSLGSGYTKGCAGGAITGGTALLSHAAYTECGVVNGRAVLYLRNRGLYSSLAGLAIGAITATPAGVDAVWTVKGNPTTLHIPGYVWDLGSTQSIVIAGTTGAWAGMNGAHTATVTGRSHEGTLFTVDFDSSGLTGTPTGTITVAPGVTAAYTFSTVAGGGTAAIAVSSAGTASITFAANTTVRGDVTFDTTYGSTTNVIAFNPGVTVTMDSTQAAGSPMYRILGINGSQNYRTIYAHCAGNPCRLEGAGNVTGLDVVRQGPRMDIDSMQFYRVGDASLPSINADMSNGRSFYTVINSVFDTCGRIAGGSLETTVVYHHDNNVHTNSPVGAIPARTYNFTAGTTVAITTPGNWTVRGNVFDLGIGNENPVLMMSPVISFSRTTTWARGGLPLDSPPTRMPHSHATTWPCRRHSTLPEGPRLAGTP